MYYLLIYLNDVFNCKFYSVAVDSSLSGLQFPNSLPSNMDFSTPSQASYQSLAPLEQQPSSVDLQSFQSGSQAESNPTGGAVVNYSLQWSRANNNQEQIYSASQNQVAPPDYFSQPYPQCLENHIPPYAYTQQAYSQDPPLSYSSAAITAGHSLSNSHPGQSSLSSAPNYSTLAQLPPNPFQSQPYQPQSQYYLSGQVSSSVQAPANQPYTPTSSVQQPVYNSHLKSLSTQSVSLSRHQQMTQRLKSTNAAKSVQDQQRFNSFNRQYSYERTPGTPLSSDEWNALKCPVSLIHDSNFLPSDGPEKPPLPILTTKVGYKVLSRCFQRVEMPYFPA